MSQPTLETDREQMLKRLADPDLLDAAVAVPVGKTANGDIRYRLAVPVGGSRRAGYLTIANHAEALATLSTLNVRPGFPSARVRGTVTAPGASRTVIWGENPPCGDAVARWKHFGYSDEAIAQYERRALESL
nr:DUF6302 family protein [Streptomyces sp. NBC_00857]